MIFPQEIFDKILLWSIDARVYWIEHSNNHKNTRPRMWIEDGPFYLGGPAWRWGADALLKEARVQLQNTKNGFSSGGICKMEFVKNRNHPSRIIATNIRVLKITSGFAPADYRPGKIWDFSYGKST